MQLMPTAFFAPKTGGVLFGQAKKGIRPGIKPLIFREQRAMHGPASGGL
jgi:hypothetical protein